MDARTVYAYDKAIQYENLKQYFYPINLFHDANVQCFEEIQHLFVLLCNHFKGLQPLEGLVILEVFEHFHRSEAVFRGLKTAS